MTAQNGFAMTDSAADPAAVDETLADPRVFQRLAGSKQGKIPHTGAGPVGREIYDARLQSPGPFSNGRCPGQEAGPGGFPSVRKRRNDSDPGNDDVREVAIQRR